MPRPARSIVLALLIAVVAVAAFIVPAAYHAITTACIVALAALLALSIHRETTRAHEEGQRAGKRAALQLIRNASDTPTGD